MQTDRQKKTETRRKADIDSKIHTGRKERKKKKKRNLTKTKKNTYKIQKQTKTDRKKITERNDAKAIFFVPLTSQSN